MNDNFTFLDPGAIDNAKSSFFLIGLYGFAPKRSQFLDMNVEYNRPAKWRRQGSFVRIWAKGSVPLEMKMVHAEIGIMIPEYVEDEEGDLEVLTIITQRTPYSDLSVLGKFMFPAWYLMDGYQKDMV